MSANMEDVSIVRIAEYGVTVADHGTSGEKQHAFLTVVTHSGDVKHLQLDSSATCCRVAGLLLDAADLIE